MDEIIIEESIEHLKSESSINGTNAKTLDIYQHLKLNIKNSYQNCKCKNTSYYYCIPCKVTTCPKCNYIEHCKHILISKKNFILSETKVDQLFSALDSQLSTNKLIDYQSNVKEELITKIDCLINNINAKLNSFRIEKIKQIDMMFDELSNCTKNIEDKIQQTKEIMKEYIAKNKKFFNLDLYDDDNNFVNNPASFNLDEDNTYFLTNYELINLCHCHCFELSQLAESIDDDLTNYSHAEQLDYTDIENIFDKMMQENPRILSYSQISRNTNQIESSRVEYYNQYQHFFWSCKELRDHNFEDIISRISKYDKQISKFKKGIYNIYRKYGNFKEIERLITNYEKTSQKGVEGLFSQRRITGQKPKTEINKYYPKIPFANKDDVCLNNTLLIKYYSYLILDLYDKNFKITTKELQSSHADLLIKVNEDEEQDYGRPIEGTNEIVIYQKNPHKLLKKSLKLTKNPYGYTKFPIGCRSLLIGDKLYISGGKNETHKYGNVIIYDRKTNTLKRIMDLRAPRAYHTMVFSEALDTIIVFGGENITSVEIFDPLTNRWQLLPELNIPRSNTLFYFDKPRGIMYSMFGIEGNIMESKYSDIIEFLDLTAIKNGWMVMDYQNKSQIDLRTLINIFVLNNDLILLYGGVGFRNSKKSICLLNIPKCEVDLIDNKFIDTLRQEAKKNTKLSSIVSTISLKS